MEKEIRGEIPTVRTETAYKAGWMDEVAKSAKSDTSSRVHKVDADGAGGK